MTPAPTLRPARLPSHPRAPVDKGGEDPTAPQHLAHLACYQAKQVDEPPFTRRDQIFVQNQFGPETLDLKKPSLVSIPATAAP